jgi:hypothetical protein
MNEAQEAFMAQMRADTERFHRQQARRQRIALWLTIPYGAAAGAAGVGATNTLNAGMRGTFALLSIGFVLLVGVQWIVPYVTRRLERKD